MAQLANAKVCGIYFLWLGDKIVYVGQSHQIRLRVLQHVDEAVKVFDGLSFISCPSNELNRRERYFIEALIPRYNACKIAKRARKDAPWRAARQLDPPMMGLSRKQLSWANEQFGAPRQIRIPRKSVRRWVHKVVAKWAEANPEQFEAAKAYQPDQGQP
jgi:hypothetical protein